MRITHRVSGRALSEHSKRKSFQASAPDQARPAAAYWLAATYKPMQRRALAWPTGTYTEQGQDMFAGQGDQSVSSPADGVLGADAAETGVDSWTRRSKPAYCSLKLWFRADANAIAALEFPATAAGPTILVHGQSRRITSGDSFQRTSCLRPAAGMRKHLLWCLDTCKPGRGNSWTAAHCAPTRPEPPRGPSCAYPRSKCAPKVCCAQHLALISDKGPRLHVGRQGRQQRLRAGPDWSGVGCVEGVRLRRREG